MEGEESRRQGPSGEASFSGLVLMLGTTALVHLGATPDPEGGEPRVDLAQAKHLIDLLEVLQVKTSGNLTSEESRLTEGLLFDLRMRYLAKAKGS